MPVQSVKIGERRFKLPFVDLIPFDATQDKELGESIEAKKKVLVPIVCWKEKQKENEETVVDGAHRVRWAAEHGLAKLPVAWQSFASEEEARDACWELNEKRRQMSADELSQRRLERANRAAAARAGGESIRTIAEREGVSVGQVQRDLELTEEQNGQVYPPDTPESVFPSASQDNSEKKPESSPTVTGRDGKTYSKNGKPKVLCPRCQRVGEVDNCQACAELRKPKPKGKGKRKGKGSKGAPAPAQYVDGIPKGVQNALADTWHAECAEALEKMKKQAKAAFTWSSWLDGGVVQALEDARQYFLSAMPRRLCPDCKGMKSVEGKGCTTCRQGGFLASQV